MAVLADIVFDCRRASTHDDAEIQHLAAIGLTPDTDPTVMVGGPGPRLCFQEVEEPKLTKNRLHLDVAVADRRTEVDRLQVLGASVLYESEEWTTMLDPEGNEFCLDL